MGILGFLCGPIISGTLERLKKFFIYTQTFWAPWKYPEAWNFPAGWELKFCPIILGKLKRFKIVLIAAHHSGCSLIGREYIGDNNITSSCEHKGVWNKGVKLTSLFHTNLILNLEKMKIFIPEANLSQHKDNGHSTLATNYIIFRNVENFKNYSFSKIFLVKEVIEFSRVFFFLKWKFQN